jgi:hypothetical protein
MRFTVERFWARVSPPDSNGCREWQGCRSELGYGQVKRDRVRWPTHRLAYVLAVGPIPDGFYVLHRCDNRACCEPTHLFLGTQMDNIADMVAKGRQGGALGERNANSKLTPDAVRAIRAAYAGGNVPQRVLAERYGVSRGLIGHVVRGRIWAHA